MHFLRKTLLFCCFFCTANILFGSPPPPDSLYKLNCRDTILVRQSASKELTFYHKVLKKQTLFSIAAFYGCSVEEVIRLNPVLKEGKGLSLGQLLNISLPLGALKKYREKDFLRWKYCAVYFPYSKKETLFSTAKGIFDVSVDTVIAVNKLAKNIELAEGQLLRVGWLSTNGIADSLRKTTKRDTSSGIKKLLEKMQPLKEKFDKDVTGKRIVNQQGVAFWQRAGGQNTDLYALHRTAPPNSIIAVTNPMKRRTIYVRVIDRLPDNVYGDEVKVILSPAVARLLGARDPRFFVKIKYSQ